MIKENHKEEALRLFKKYVKQRNFHNADLLTMFKYHIASLRLENDRDSYYEVYKQIEDYNIKIEEKCGNLLECM